MMYSRLGALIVGMIVAGAQVSLVVCEVVCATRASAGTSQHCRHSTPPTVGHDVLSSQEHACGHGNELPTSSSVTSDQRAPAPGLAAVTSRPFPTSEMVPLAEAGYTRYLGVRYGLQPGIGATLSAALVPAALQPRYGGIGLGLGVFLTVRPAAHQMTP